MPPTQLAHPSPKRKREQAPHVPLLNTALRPASTPPPVAPAPSSAPDSPRNAVADQLQGMTLVPVMAIPMSPLSPADEVMHKKPKLEAVNVNRSPSLDSIDAITNPRTGRTGSIVTGFSPIPRLLDSAREIPETPQQPRILPDIAAFAQTTTFRSSIQSAPTLQSARAFSAKARTQNRSSSQPQPLARSPSPPPSALTWHDSEITGHLADPSLDPDDDGTGLNGIGFKPTPAMAYARSQRRRQQLNEWKARETREARAKRQERRRRGVGSNMSRETTVERDLSVVDEGTQRRTVKFAI